MPIKTIDNWADAGSVSEPTTAKKALGWIDGESPPAAYENWVHNDSRNKINEIVEDGPDPYSPFATDTTLMMKYIPATGDGKGSAFGLNYYMRKTGASGFLTRLVDTCFWINSDGEKKIFALDHDACEINVFDVATLAYESDTSLSAGFGAAVGNWCPLSMCCDGSYIYVVAYDDGSTATRIQSFACNGFAVNGGWPATGRALTAQAVAPAGNYLYRHTVCFANTTTLAVTQPWVAIAAAATPAVQLVAVGDGSIGLAGAGDSPTGTIYALGPVTSDGTNLYFLTFNGTNSYICSATIANPQVGGGGTNYPFTVTATPYSEGVCIRHIGSQIVSSFYDPSANQNMFYISSPGEAYVGSIAAAGGSNLILSRAGHFDFDGRYIWAHGISKMGVERRTAVFCIDTSMIQNGNAGDPYDVEITDAYCIRHIYALTDDDLTLNASGIIVPVFGRVLFDGRDIWVIGDPQPSVTGWSGYIWGVYKAGMKG